MALLGVTLPTFAYSLGLDKGSKKRDDDTIKRNACQYRWRDNTKERHDALTTTRDAISMQPRHKDKDVERDLDQARYDVQSYEEVCEIGDKKENKSCRS